MATTPMTLGDVVRRLLLSRRYWAFFLLAITILTVQLLLSVRITDYSSSSYEENSGRNTWPQDNSEKKLHKKDIGDFNSRTVAINSRPKQLHADDEDNEVISNEISSKYSSSVQNKLNNNFNFKSSVGEDIKDINLSVKSPDASSSKTMNLDELDFEPSCQITTKEAISALNRATTQRCKEKIVNITCLQQAGELYPRQLPRYCHLKEGMFGDSLGCFRDSAKPRILSGHASRLLANNSPENCLNFCMRLGYRFAGVEYSNQCFCGNDVPAKSAKIEQSFCNMTCPPTSTLSSKVSPHLCGGYYAIDIFRTGLANRKKNEASHEEDSKGLRRVRIAFVFTVNGRAIRQLKRLLRNLYSPRHFYLFHVDKRQDYLHRELKLLEKKLPNVKVLSERLSTIWGGASLLTVLLRSVKMLLTTPGWTDSWDYMINLSESDFPIKSLDRLEMFLTANKGKNFVKSHGQDTQRFITKQGLDKTFFECDNHMWRLGDRQLPYGIRWDGGSDWVALHREFCSYLIGANNTLLSGLKQIYRHTLLPAESYFHTLLQNSEFCDTIIDNNLHITNWRRKQGCKCQYKHIVDWCGCSPNDFKEDDWTKIVVTEEKPFYFARKFEAVISQGIVGRIERWIDSTVPTDVSANKYWESVYNHQDASPPANDGLLSFFAITSLVSSKKLSYMCQAPEIVLNYGENSPSEEPYYSHRIIESHSYFEDDEFKGIINSYDVEFQANRVKMSVEVFSRQNNHMIIHRRPGPIERLINIQVCSNFDLKEQLFRNFGCVLSPFSEVAASHKWTTGSENFTATFVWVDPASVVAGSYEIKIETTEKDVNSIILHHKPVFNLPLRPGSWRLLLLYDWVVVAETRFMVLPFVYYNGKPVGEDQVKFLHNGPALKYVEHNFTAIESLLGLHEKQSSQLRVAGTNARRFGLDLHQWAENIFSEFWSVQDICAINSTSHCASAQIDSCQTVEWSSHFPDPKSEISTHQSFERPRPE